jgi:deoxyribose-phosphate aldolase
MSGVAADPSGRPVRSALESASTPAEQARLVAGLIDHTLLRADASSKEIDTLCDEAVRCGFYSACIHPLWVRRCASRLKGAAVRICSVSGFPFGAALPEVKRLEARRAVEEGADEIDMVIQVGALREGRKQDVAGDIRGVVEAADGRPVKVILECCDLTDDQIRMGCRLAAEAGAHFVKTSTGIGRHGATEEHVRLLREAVGDRLGVKASGGIRDLETCIGMLRAGANRIGTSAGVKIVGGLL